MIEASSHLIIIDESSCDQTNAEQISDPKILNYYRQFLIEGFDDWYLVRRAKKIAHIIWGVLSLIILGFKGSAIEADSNFNFENADINLKITEAISRVFSGVSAILDFEIINFRPYDCSDEMKQSNCRIVELYLTVDTFKKMQNGVNIDESIDRWG